MDSRYSRAHRADGKVWDSRVIDQDWRKEK